MLPAGPTLIGYVSPATPAIDAWLGSLRRADLTEISVGDGLTNDGRRCGMFIRRGFVSDAAVSDQTRVAAVLGSPYPLGGSAPDTREFARQMSLNSDSALAAFGGTFAFASIEAASARVVLAVDRFAVENLFYFATADCLLFANHAQVLAQHPAIARRFSAQSIYDALYHHCLPGPGAGYLGVHRLLPGERAKWDGHLVRTHRYWQPTYPAVDIGNTRTLEAELREVTSQAVARRLPDAGVACFLSGGLDSSTVTGCAAQLRQQDVVAYTIGFDAEGYDEMEFARTVAQHFGVRHESYYVTPQDIIDSLPAIVAEFDAPFGNASAVPTYFCAKSAARDGHTRILAGDGGDELFGGNVRYTKQLLFDRYQRVPGLVRQGLLEPLAKRVKSAPGVFGKALSYVRQAAVPMPDRLMTYNLLNWIAPESFLSHEFLAMVDTAAPLNVLRDMYATSESIGTVNRLLRMDWRLTLADSDLPKVSRMCALAGIEVEYPMLDERVVELAGRVPASDKVTQRELRPFFRRAFGDFLPASTLKKSKQGFGLPFGVWLSREGPLRDFAQSHLAQLETAGLLKPGFRDDFLCGRLNQHPAYFGTLLWILITLALWMEHRQPDWHT
jgi:asparagine synthase (glutamine-hydrolysing)